MRRRSFTPFIFCGFVLLVRPLVTSGIQFKWANYECISYCVGTDHTNLFIIYLKVISHQLQVSRYLPGLSGDGWMWECTVLLCVDRPSWPKSEYLIAWHIRRQIIYIYFGSTINYMPHFCNLSRRDRTDGNEGKMTTIKGNRRDHITPARCLLLCKEFLNIEITKTNFFSLWKKWNTLLYIYIYVCNPWLYLKNKIPKN